MFMFIMSLDTFTTADRVGAIAEILTKSTQFQGRFIDDIFILMFTRPSEAAKKAGLLGAVGAAAVTGIPTAIAGGIGGFDLVGLLPNFYSFVFRINPYMHERTQTRARQTILTKGGYLTQYWSAGMKSMTFKGSTGSLCPPNHSANTEGFNIRQTVQYTNFLNLRKFYEEANMDVTIFFLGRLLVGAMSDFSFTEDANTPYAIEYSFKFEAYPEFKELA